MPIIDIQRILLGKKNQGNPKTKGNDENLDSESSEAESEHSDDSYGHDDVEEELEEEEIQDESMQTNLIDSLNQAVGPTSSRKRQRPEEIEEPYTSINPSLLFTSHEGQGIADESGQNQGLTDAQLFSVFGNDSVERKKIKTILEPGKLKKKKNAESQGKGTESLSLTTSLEKPVVQKIQRTILYDHVKKDVNKWNAVVYNNRVSDQLVFPLETDEKQPKHILLKDDCFVPETPLEEEIARILHGDDYIQKKKLEVYGSKAEETEDQIYVRTISDALEKHDELAKLRALQSYEMAKAKRRNKIKSKKYHRIIKREKIRKQLKEFEELQKKDPDSALEKLEELERARITERMNLKHRNTSKWAKMQLSRAKYDRDSRQAISEQLEISRALTSKVAESSSSENETDIDDLDLELPTLVKSSLDNPWLLTNQNKDNEKLKLYYTGYKKLWTDINERRDRELRRQEKEAQRKKKEEEGDKAKERQINEVEVLEDEDSMPAPKKAKKQITKKPKLKKLKKKSKSTSTELNIPSDLVPSGEITADDIDNLLYFADEKLTLAAKKKLKELSTKPTKQKIVKRKTKAKKLGTNRDGDFDEIRDLKVDDSEINFEVLDDDMQEEPEPTVQLQPKKSKKKTEEIINPLNFLHVNKAAKFDLKSANETLDFQNSESEDDEEGRQRKIIAEAFEDDDVFVEFQNKKEAEIESSKPKDIDLNLPGWGSWAGNGIEFKPKKKFIKKAPTPKPRSDSGLPHVILNQNLNDKIRQHQVRTLPFPFTRVKDYEKSIRAPIGRTWLPEQGMKGLIAPRVITKLGQAIQPISEEVLLRKKSNHPNNRVKLAGIRSRDTLKEDKILF